MSSLKVNPRAAASALTFSFVKSVKGKSSQALGEVPAISQLSAPRECRLINTRAVTFNDAFHAGYLLAVARSYSTFVTLYNENRNRLNDTLDVCLLLVLEDGGRGHETTAIIPQGDR
jgi:hypothetical protein